MHIMCSLLMQFVVLLYTALIVFIVLHHYISLIYMNIVMMGWDSQLWVFCGEVPCSWVMREVMGWCRGHKQCCAVLALLQAAWVASTHV